MTPETKAVIESAREFCNERTGLGRDHMHGWQLDLERAYLVNADLFDRLAQALAALDAAQAAQEPVCRTCGDTGLILEHPADVPFSQSLAAIGGCPDCGDGTKSSGEIQG